ncbi:MAG: GrpB family protein [bacterium]
MAADDPATWRNERVRLVPHDPAWAARFEAEADLLQATIGAWVTGGIHHIGSTAVPGLDAKPIIDIAVGVESLEASRPCIDRLSKIDYLYSPYRGELMHWFCKPDPARRTHHLHLIPTGSARLEDEIVFRDYLCTHPAVADEYGDLKRRLAAELGDDREAYTSAKADFVESVTAAAHAWRPGSTTT